MRRVCLAVVLSALAVLPGLALAETATISGAAGYRERIALAPGAVLEISLQDVSRADAAAPVLSSQRFAMSGVPHAFRLNYDPDLIDERLSYSVSAKILVDEQVLFRTTSHNAVLTRGAGDELDLMLTKMSTAGTKELAGSNWEVFELGGKRLATEKLPTLQFDSENRVAAHAGCNRFNGSYAQGPDRLSFSPNMAGTMMACPPPYDELEKEFIATLGQVTGIVSGGDQAALISENGVTVLRMRIAN